MSLLNRFLESLSQRGLSVGPGKKPGELLLHGPHKEATPEIMRGLRAFKPQLLKRFSEAETAGQSEPKAEPEPQPEPEPELCRVCNRDVSDPEDRERLRDPLYCDRGGSREVRDGSGTLRPATQRCPFKG